VWIDTANDQSSKNIAVNDVMGNFSVTLIDVLDTLVVLDDRQGFDTAVRNVIEWVSFDVNTKPQVFETTIRVLGGLLSGHLFATKAGQPFYLPWYKGELLELARDLADRLMPAFSTPTGLPYARVYCYILYLYLQIRSIQCVFQDQPTAWPSERRDDRDL
jgi:mannosidase alpha-like ER degradation enhancer 1